MAATKEYYDAQKQMVDMLFKVIELAGKPENQDALGGLRHLLLGDAGTRLANTMEKAGTEHNGVKMRTISPETEFLKKCANYKPEDKGRF